MTMLRRGTGLLCALACLISPTVSAASDAPPLTGEDVTPKLRSFKGSVRYYPEIAQSAGVEGRATALCSIAENGNLVDCAIQSEEPAGCQFGAAVATLAEMMRVPPRTKKSEPTPGRRFLFDLRFKLPDGPRASSC
jgi:hypothetical protein